MTSLKLPIGLTCMLLDVFLLQSRELYLFQFNTHTYIKSRMGNKFTKYENHNFEQL